MFNKIDEKISSIDEKINKVSNLINDYKLNVKEAKNMDDIDLLEEVSFDELELFSDDDNEKKVFTVKIVEYELRSNMIMILLNSGYKVSLDNDLITIEENLEKFY